MLGENNGGTNPLPLNQEYNTLVGIDMEQQVQTTGADPAMQRAYAEEKAKLRREKSKEAIALTLEGDWERATDVNKEILQLFPNDVDALNRLGKAYLELGRYTSARTSFESALRTSPHNTIAKKNLERLFHLQDTAPSSKQTKAVTPYLFIEESGKSVITLLRNTPPFHVIAKMAAGDPVKLEARDYGLVVKNDDGEFLGQLEPKLGLRLKRLMNGGNRYDAAIISVNREEVSVVILEAYRHPDMSGVCSFPTRSRDEYKVYWRDAPIRYDVDRDSEDESFSAWRDAPIRYDVDRDSEDESFSAWRDGDSETVDLSDGEEPAGLTYAAKADSSGQEEDEE